jgi:hypothetical protein
MAPYNKIDMRIADVTELVGFLEEASLSPSEFFFRYSCLSRFGHGAVVEDVQLTVADHLYGRSKI